MPTARSIGNGQAVVAVVLAYVLLLMHLPLVPLGMYVLRPPAPDHCTHVACPHKYGAPCPHHAAMTHHAASAMSHAATPTLQPCGPDAATPIALPVLSKALLPLGVASGAAVQPPLHFVDVLNEPRFYFVHDVFHPPPADLSSHS